MGSNALIPSLLRRRQELGTGFSHGSNSIVVVRHPNKFGFEANVKTANASNTFWSGFEANNVYVNGKPDCDTDGVTVTNHTDLNSKFCAISFATVGTYRLYYDLSRGTFSYGGNYMVQGFGNTDSYTITWIQIPVNAPFGPNATGSNKTDGFLARQYLFKSNRVIDCLSKTPPYLNNINSTPNVENMVIRVPRGCRAAYVADDCPWRYVADFIEEVDFVYAPTITTSVSSLSLSTTPNTPVTGTFTVQGRYLSGNTGIELSVSGTGFSISHTHITHNDAVGGKTVTVTYSPTAAGSATGKVTLKAAGANAEEIVLSGTAQVINAVTAEESPGIMARIYATGGSASADHCTEAEAALITFASLATSTNGPISASEINEPWPGFHYFTNNTEIPDSFLKSVKITGVLRIPNTVTKLNDQSTRANSFSTIIIPASVTTIGRYNLLYGNTIDNADVIFLGETPPTTMDYVDCISDANYKHAGHIYVPNNSVSAYKTKFLGIGFNSTLTDSIVLPLSQYEGEL